MQSKRKEEEEEEEGRATANATVCWLEVVLRAAIETLDTNTSPPLPKDVVILPLLFLFKKEKKEQKMKRKW